MSQTRHPSSRRRADEKKEAEDVFLEKTVEFAQWSKDHSQPLVLGGIILAVLVAGGVYYANYRSNWEEQAVSRLEAVEASLAFGDRQTARSELTQYVNQFDGTVYALEARVVLGQSLLEDGTPDVAIEALAPAVREMAKQPIAVQAAFLLASAYEEAGRPEDAEDLFLRISNATELPFQIREALAGAARIRTLAGDFAGAADLYEEVLSTMELGDPERSFWEMRLGEVSARG